MSREQDTAVVRMPLQSWFEQEGKVVHGGLITSLADTSAVYAIGHDALTGIEFKINFLQPARLDGGPLTGHARVMRRGKRIAVCTVDVKQADVVVATGLFTFLLR